MKTSEFDYELPEELIAQLPTQKREMSRMMVVHKDTKKLESKHFFNIIDYLNENDVLVLNNTKVIPARLLGLKKETGAHIEVFLLKNSSENLWECLIKPAKRVKGGTIIEISEELSVKVIRKTDNEKWIIELISTKNSFEMIKKYGNIPLPPYIERNLSKNEYKNLDFERYQTVFAENEGSVAAPTAGLHFTKEILEQLKQKGVQICYVTLNVGLGTFRPVKAENVEEHKMDIETFEISAETAEIINKAKKSGKKIVAVGTTSVRTLETTFQKYGEIKAVKDFSQLFITPGFKFCVVDKLITNFHLPKSTLIMLVSAFAGKDFIFKAYKEAVYEGFRFYSYGDCMLIL